MCSSYGAVLYSDIPSLNTIQQCSRAGDFIFVVTPIVIILPLTCESCFVYTSSCLLTLAVDVTAVPGHILVDAVKAGLRLVLAVA